MHHTRINQSLESWRTWWAGVDWFPDWRLAGGCGDVEECVGGNGVPFYNHGISIFGHA